MNGTFLSHAADELKSALAFLTAVPVGAVPPSAETVKMFPAVGMLLGVSEGLFYKLAKKIFPGYMAAAATVFFDLIITSGIHLDGLADSADGLLAHVPEKSRFLIMKEPTVGAYGVTAIVLALTIKTLAMAEGEAAPADFVLMMTLSREIAKTIIQKSTYAKEEGLAAQFKDLEAPGNKTSAVFGKGNNFRLSDFGITAICVSVILFYVTKSGKKYAGKSAFSLLFSLLPVFFIHKNAKNKLGGYTGDTIGASIEVYELSYLLLRSVNESRKYRG